MRSQAQSWQLLGSLLAHFWRLLWAHLSAKCMPQPLLWSPPSLVFGSKGDDKDRPEPTEPVFAEFSVRFNAQ